MLLALISAGLCQPDTGDALQPPPPSLPPRWQGVQPHTHHTHASRAGRAGCMAQNISRHRVSASTGSNRALSGRILAGGTADTRGLTDTAPTMAHALPAPRPTSSSHCPSPGGVPGMVTQGTGASGHEATSQGKSAASSICSV